MKEINFSKLADIDIKDAIDYYNWKKSELGDRFFDKLQLKIEKIRTNPESYAYRFKNVRFAKIDQFPFIIQFINEPDAIIIISIMHTSRNPQLWKDRI
jgi:toxin ParE1/3/4